MIQWLIEGHIGDMDENDGAGFGPKAFVSPTIHWGFAIGRRPHPLVVEMPDYEADYPDMMEAAYIFFDGKSGNEIAFIARPWQTSSAAC